MEGRLSGRRALVTGSAQGLGAAIARRFAREGAAVMLTDVRDEQGEALAAEIREQGGDARFQHLDVCSPAEWDEAVRRAEQEQGGVDVLVLNARVWIRGTLLDVSLEDWDRLMAVNLRSAVIGLKAVLPGMLAAGKGSIVAVGSSIGGEVGTADGSAYQASKAGLTALMRSVAVAHGAEGVRANAVHSGPMRTETIVETGFAPAMEKIASQFPIPRPAETDEVAAVVAFLASDEASYVTASKVVPDGGSSSALLANL